LALLNVDMSPPREKSKRQALRFTAPGHSIRYKTEFEDGSASIENVSTGGCAMSGLDVPLSFEEKILLLLELSEEILEIGAKVIRVEDNAVAVQFTDITEEYSSKIIKYFAQKQREFKLT
jgi:c-di-GMP-binding flagellar brake protein YcgR